MMGSRTKRSMGARACLAAVLLTLTVMSFGQTAGRRVREGFWGRPVARLALARIHVARAARAWGRPRLPHWRRMDQQTSLRLPPGGLVGLETRSGLPSGPAPVGMITADFNGDGNADLVVANAGDSTLWYYAGKSGGGFALPRIIPLSPCAGCVVTSITAASLRGNGTLDLLVLYADQQDLTHNAVGVFLGHGDGTFAPEKDYPVTGFEATSMAVGHFLSQSRLDLAVNGTDMLGVGYLSLIPGNGDGTLGAQQPAVTTDVAGEMLSVDFNHDGWDDLLLTQGPLDVLLNNGNGTFTTAITGGSSGAAVGDLNGDGCPDIVAFIGGDAAQVELGNCQGGFSQGETFALGVTGGPGELVDLNGDGKLDLVAAGINGGDVSPATDPSTGVAVALGDGAGGFGPVRIYRGRYNQYGLAVGNFNGGSKPDIATVGTYGDGVCLLPNDGSGGFGTPAGIPTAVYESSDADPWMTVFTGNEVLGLEATDVNGDGIPDLVTVEGEGGQPPWAIAAYLGNGTSYDAPVLSKFQPGTAKPDWPVAAVAGDFRGTGSQDLLVTTLKGYIFAANEGGGHFQPSAEVSFNSGFVASAVAVGDFNGDGHLDFAAFDGTMVEVYLGHGDGTFTLASTVAMPEAPYPPNQLDFARIFAADLDGDGVLDLLVSDGENTTGDPDEAHVFELRGHGDGTFAPPAAVPGVHGFITLTRFAQGGPWGLVAVALESNGSVYSRVDSEPPAISTYVDTGDGSFAPVASYGAFQGFQYWIPSTMSADVADFNGDGNADIVVYETPENYPGRVYAQLLVGEGDGTFVPGNDTFPINTYMAPQGVSTAALGQTAGAVELSTYEQSLQLLPAAPAPGLQLSVEENPVPAGGGEGVITLNLTPSVDTVVGLSSSDAGIEVPAQVTVPAGSASTAFSFAVAAGYDPAQVFTISAQAEGSTATAWGWVTPGAGGASGLVLAPAQLEFHNQVQGTSSTQPVTLTNEGGAPVAISGVSTTMAASAGMTPIANVFSQTNNCPASLAMGASCTVQVTFTPPTAVMLNVGDLIRGSVQIQEAGGASQQIGLQAQAYWGAANVWLSPGNYNFGNVTVGESASVTETLYNGETGALSIGGVTVTGSPGFSQTNTCGGSLAAGARCTITVSLAPLTVQGPIVATVMVQDGAGGAPLAGQLEGTAAPEISGTWASGWTMASTVGASTPFPPLTLTNNAGTTLALQGITVTGPFTETNNCGSSLAAGQSCTADIVFQPARSGLFGGDLEIAFQGLDSPTQVGLSGTAGDVNFSATANQMGVTAGQTASFPLTVQPINGARETVSLTCNVSGAADTGCVVNPGQVNLNSSDLSVTVAVTTVAPSLTPGGGPSPGWPYLLLGLMGWITCLWLAQWRQPRRRRVWAWGMGIALAVVLVGCGGGGAALTQGNTGPPPVSGTPAGTYTVTVNAANPDGQAVGTTQFLLNVTAP